MNSHIKSLSKYQLLYYRLFKAFDGMKSQFGKTNGDAPFSSWLLKMIKAKDTFFTDEHCHSILKSYCTSTPQTGDSELDNIHGFAFKTLDELEILLSIRGV